MKLHPLVFLLVLFLAVGGGFGVGLFVQSRHPLLPPAPVADPNALPKPAGGSDLKADYRRAVLVDYLDGKEFQGKSGKPLTFRKDGIQAVQFSDVATQSGNNPWGTDVTVLATADGKRYAVHARLEYRKVEDTVVIVSFTPSEVSPQ